MNAKPKPTWLNETGVPASLCQAIKEKDDLLPKDEDLSRLAAGISARLTAGGDPAAGSTEAAGSAGGDDAPISGIFTTGTWIVIAVAVIAIGAAVVGLTTQSDDAPSAAPRPPEGEADGPVEVDHPQNRYPKAEAEISAPPDGTEPSLTAPQKASPSEPPSSARKKTGNGRRPPQKAESHEEKPALPEAALLAEAKRIVKKDPKRALALTRMHARRFPNGTLVQEREVLAIRALFQIGNKNDAQKRGEAFLRAFPSSIHRSALESLFGADTSKSSLNGVSDAEEENF